MLIFDVRNGPNFNCFCEDMKLLQYYLYKSLPFPYWFAFTSFQFFFPEVCFLMFLFCFMLSIHVLKHNTPLARGRTSLFSLFSFKNFLMILPTNFSYKLNDQPNQFQEENFKNLIVYLLVLNLKIVIFMMLSLLV